MATKRALIKLVRSFLEDTPIFADWLEDHCNADRQWLEPVQDSLRSNIVVVEAHWVIGPHHLEGLPFYKSSSIGWQEIRRGNKALQLRSPDVTTKPIIRYSTERLCMEGRSSHGQVRWIFKPPSRLGDLFNPLLFGLCCIQYGWVKHPVIDRVLCTFQENGANLWTP